MQIWIKVGTESVVLSRKFRIIIKPEKLGKIGTKISLEVSPDRTGAFSEKLVFFLFGKFLFSAMHTGWRTGGLG